MKAIREPFEHIRAVALSERMIDKWIEESPAIKSAPATINGRTRLLQQAYRLGRKKVGLGPDIRKLPVSNARTGFLEKSGIEAIVLHLPDDLPDFARFGYLIGMRKSETASLGWAQYDKKAQVLTLEAEHSKKQRSTGNPDRRRTR